MSLFNLTPFVTIARNDFALAESPSGRHGRGRGGRGGRGGGRGNSRQRCKGDFLRLYNPTTSSSRDVDDMNSKSTQIDFCGSLSGDKRINLVRSGLGNLYVTFSADNKATAKGFRLRVCLP